MVLSITLPAVPDDWDNDKSYVVSQKLSGVEEKSVQPVGESLFGYIRRKKHKRTYSEDQQIESVLKETVEETDDIESEEESELLYTLDPKDWKEQDHYLVLGISSLRYKATEEQIKKAYRKKVLKHHPDKKASTGNTNDDNFFKCIQKAWEVLGDPIRRRQFDSVDPTFDESVPDKCEPEDFYDEFGPVFENNARFSTVTPVPSLGDENTSRQEVEEFYRFWYNFDSWRSFEYKDEEEKEGFENRYDKRYYDKKNKAARAKLKKEDNQRITKLVDNAYRSDPRLKKFKNDDKLAKEAKRKEREEAKRLAEEEQRKKEEAKRLIEEKKREKERELLNEEKKKRDQQKKLIKKEKKNVRNLLKESNYVMGDKTPSIDEIDTQITKVERVMDGMSLEDLTDFSKNFEEKVKSDVSAAAAYIDELYNVEVEKEKERQRELAKKELKIKEQNKKKTKKLPWSAKETATLINAIKLYPGGATNRWEKIAAYVNDHGGEDDETESMRKKRMRRPEDVIKMAREIQKNSSQEADEINRAQLQNIQNKVSNYEIKDAPTQRYDSPVSSLPSSGNTSPANTPPSARAAPLPWTAEQQKLLEGALRQYPAAKFKANPAERWELIAKAVGRSKRDVKLRVKELAEMVKRKKK